LTSNRTFSAARASCASSWTASRTTSRSPSAPIMPARRGLRPMGPFRPSQRRSVTSPAFSRDSRRSRPARRNKNPQEWSRDSILPLVPTKTPPFSAACDPARSAARTSGQSPRPKRAHRAEERSFHSPWRSRSSRSSTVMRSGRQSRLHPAPSDARAGRAAPLFAFPEPISCPHRARLLTPPPAGRPPVVSPAPGPEIRAAGSHTSAKPPSTP